MVYSGKRWALTLGKHFLDCIHLQIPNGPDKGRVQVNLLVLNGLHPAQINKKNASKEGKPESNALARC